MEKINYGLFLTVVALLPYPQICLRYGCVIWIISWLLEGRWLSKTHLQSSITHYQFLPFLLFGLWYAWHAVSWFWAPDHGAWAWQMERYMAFGMMVPVGLWGVNKLYKSEQILRVLAITAWIAVPVYALTMGCIWKEQVTGMDFIAENISHIKHRLFLCTVEFLGMAAAIRVWRHRPVLLTCALLTMASIVVVSGSRQAIITIAVLAAIILIYSLPKPYRLRYGIGIFILGLTLGIGLLSLHPRMQELGMHGLTNMRELSYWHDLRLNVWGAALQQPSDYIVYGLGGGQSIDYLVKQYQAARMPFYVTARFHAHNQYLEEMMEIGLPGLILFLSAWLSVLLCAKKEGRRTAVILVTLIALNMFTDCFFGKFDGIAIWAVGLVLILVQSDPDRQQQPAGGA